MESSLRPRSAPRARLLGAALLAGLLLGAGAAPAATPENARGDLALSSGSFLAAIVANNARDTAAAAEFFREALKADPRNPALLDQAFLADLIDGNLPEAFRTAERSILRDKSNALAHVALGVRALKGREYVKARQSFERAGGTGRNPDLTIALLRALALVGAGDVTGALQATDRFKQGELQAFRDFFAGLIADLGKRPQEAEKRLEAAYKADPSILRVAEAYARLLSRRDRPEEAKAVLKQWQDKNPTQPFLRDALGALERGEKLEALTRTPAEGAAEVFYGLGAVGAAARDPLTAIIYLQLAHYLLPQDDLITMTLAEYFEQLRQNTRAAELYASIPTRSPFASRAAIGQAAALERSEKSEEAIAALRAVLAESPGDIDAADTLGAILRIKKRWQESVDVYQAAIKANPVLEHKHWALLFGRAIGYERLKQWPLAEADFKRALELLPVPPRTGREKAERAQVLNYLAYSWVDMHLNIEQAFEMLREAVMLTPEDGAVVDSLGWAHFRLGRFNEAVKELERAVLLRAGDATINDHLGDAYWRVGREREARFKWRQALDLSPEPEDRVKIEKKLEHGLDTPPAAAIPPAKPDGG